MSGSFSSAFSSAFSVYSSFDILTTELPDARLLSEYSQQIESTGGSGTIFSVYSGVLPSGLILSSEGLVNGIPEELGSSDFAISGIYNGYSDVSYYTISVLQLYNLSTSSPFIGLEGRIYCPCTMGITVMGVQNDVEDPNITDVYVTLSGSLGTYYKFNAVVPIVLEAKFKRDEHIDVATSGNIINTIINYIKRGDQSPFMTGHPSRVIRPEIGKWYE